ncbi:hypothetical protein JW992_01595 [candidate division KSB1 bacterium]|nr:hypothetical protein [candidate division KSB1 bacterium]
MIAKRFLIYFAGLLFGVYPLQAQSPYVPTGDRGTAAQYFLGSEDQVLMPVNVWGFVQKPGQYMVPFDTDLISLLSFAGGPREEAKITGIKVVRANQAQTAAPDQTVIQVDVKKFLESGDSNLIPVLRPGDTIVVSGTTFHFVSKFFDFAWRIAAIVQLYALVDYYTRQD